MNRNRVRMYQYDTVHRYCMLVTSSLQLLLVLILHVLVLAGPYYVGSCLYITTYCNGYLITSLARHLNNGN